MRNRGLAQDLDWAERQLLAERMSERSVVAKRMGVSSVSTHDVKSGNKQANRCVWPRVYGERIPDVNRNVAAEVWIAALRSGLHRQIAE
jgi:hypothetical protein